MVDYQTYLEEIVNDRLIPGIRQINALLATRVQIERVISMYAEVEKMPFWSLYPVSGRHGFASRAGLGQAQIVFPIGIRLWLAPIQAGSAAGTMHNTLLSWVIVPTVIDFFGTHPALVFEEGQDEPKWLDSSQTEISLINPVGVFPNVDTAVGADFQLTLVFNRQLSPVLGKY